MEAYLHRYHFLHLSQALFLQDAVKKLKIYFERLTSIWNCDSSVREDKSVVVPPGDVRIGMSDCDAGELHDRRFPSCGIPGSRCESRFGWNFHKCYQLYQKCYCLFIDHESKLLFINRLNIAKTHKHYENIVKMLCKFLQSLQDKVKSEHHLRGIAKSYIA